MDMRSMGRLQSLRLVTRILFFLLFLLAPSLDLLRVDLRAGHLVLLGQTFTPGVGAFLTQAGESPLHAGVTLIVQLILPALALVVGVLWVAHRFGRVYCGWLCPHFSVVEWINALMERALGKPVLWESAPPGTRLRPLWGVMTIMVALLMALVWALSLLTYLLPPREVLAEFLAGEPGFGPALFLSVATGVFFLDFMLARHLFCRFGCAVGMAQSLAWMANPGALAPMMRQSAGAACAGCPQDCQRVCPMRLNPRAGKRRIATCTQCGLCVQGCAGVRGHHPGGAPLAWMRGTEVSSRPNSVFIPVPGRGTPESGA
ncbi:MAG: 4Fe-4S binding protein [Magnetococcus sp. WYHC-3]